MAASGVDGHRSSPCERASLEAAARGRGESGRRLEDRLGRPHILAAPPPPGIPRSGRKGSAETRQVRAMAAESAHGHAESRGWASWRVSALALAECFAARPAYSPRCAICPDFSQRTAEQCMCCLRRFDVARPWKWFRRFWTQLATGAFAFRTYAYRLPCPLHTARARPTHAFALHNTAPP